MTRIKIVAMAYLLVGFCAFAYEYTGHWHSYYFSLTCSSLLIIAVCCRSRDLLLIAYATVNFLLMMLYTLAMCSSYMTDLVFYVLYGASINYSLIVFFVEMSILIVGGWDVIRLGHERYCALLDRHRTDCKELIRGLASE